MNLYFEGSIANNLKNNPDVSLTVFKKKDEGWEKLLDPFYSPDSKNLPRIESWRKAVTISLALNKQIAKKVCKVKKIENGTVKGPNQVGNFKWELEITSSKETYSDPNNTSIELEITDSE